jgi:hypothetical protein
MSMKVLMKEDEGREDGGFVATTAQVLDEVKNLLAIGFSRNFLG